MVATNIFEELKAELLGTQPMLSVYDVITKLADELDPCLGLNQSYPLGDGPKTSLNVFYLTSPGGEINAQIVGEITQPRHIKEHVEDRPIEERDLPKISDVTIYLINTNSQEMLTIGNSPNFETVSQSFTGAEKSESFKTYNDIKQTVAVFNANPKI